MDRLSTSGMTRRELIASLIALTVGAACSPAAAPAASTSPPAPTSAPAPTTAPPPQPTATTGTVSASPSAAPAAVQTAPAVAKPSPSAVTVTLPKPEKTSLLIGHSTLEVTGFAVHFANDLNIYPKYGFEKVETSFFEGDAKATTTLIAGQIDATDQGVAPSLTSQLTDVPVLTVSMTVTRLTDDLVGASDVKSAADLKGKKIAVSSFGSTTHGSILLSLKALGLTVDDVTIVQVGGQSSRLAALKAGTVAAAPIDQNIEDQMKAEGFNILVQLGKQPLEYARGGILVRKDWAQQNPNTTLALTAAVLEAQNAMWTQSDLAAQGLQKWAQLPDLKSAQDQIALFKTYGDRSMRWSKDAWLTMQQVLATQDEALAGVDVTKAYTTEYLDKLEQMGFYDALNIPKT